MHFCKDCNLDKEEVEFYFSKGRPYSPCKACRKIRDKKYYESNKESIIKRSLVWQKANKGVDYYRKHYLKNPECYKKAQAKYSSKPHIKAKRAARQKNREFIKNSSINLNKHFLREIEMIYLLAKDCEIVSGEKIPRRSYRTSTRKKYLWASCPLEFTSTSSRY